MVRNNTERGRVKLDLSVWGPGELRKIRALAGFLTERAGFSTEVTPLSWDNAYYEEREWIEQYDGLFRVLFTESRSTKTYLYCGNENCPSF